MLSNTTRMALRPAVLAVLLSMTLAGPSLLADCPNFNILSTRPGAGTQPLTIAAGDLNGDGQADLVVSNTASNNISVLLSTGAGTFATRVNYNALGVGEVAIGDFNGDGKPDLAIAGNFLLVRMNTGAGAFGNNATYIPHAGNGSVAVGDFNGDGKLDIVVSNFETNDVSVFLNKGNGTFFAAVNYDADTDTDAGTVGVAVGDVNGDGKLDLITLNRTAGNVAVLPGNGNGTFGAPATTAAGNVPMTLIAADFNGDGKSDIAISNYGGFDLEVLISNGTTTLGAPTSYGNPEDAALYAVAAADFNGDGKLDLAAASVDSDSVYVYLGTGIGTFGAAIPYRLGIDDSPYPHGIAAGDVDADGKPDLATANYQTGDVTILLNTCAPSPSITLISPSSGSTAGGQTVTITGLNLSGATSVKFDNSAATITNNTATSITVTTPAHSAGTVNVSVTNLAGTGTTTGGYVYVAPPTVSTVSPTSGPVAGGQTVTLSGSALGSATSVTFGGLTATINSNTSGSINVTTPAHAAGAVDVVVTTAAGSGTKSNGYTYVDLPTSGAATPSSGPAAGGQSVTIAGTNLSLTSGLKFGTTTATITNKTATTVTVTSPAHAAGLVDIVITTPGGSATSAGAYTYIPAATISSISPNSGPIAGGQSITINGANFTNASAVTFGGTGGTITNTTAGALTVTTPAHATGAVNVVVTTPGGTATSSNGYTFVALPTFTSITPTSGPAAGGQTGVVLHGTVLSNATTVTFGGTAATITGNNSTTVTVTTLAHAAGAVNVVVTTAGGSATLASGFTFIAGPNPTSVTPAAGPTAGGQTGVVISGTSLASATGVTFGGTAATITNNTATTITVTTPAHAAGAVNVIVTTAGGSATLTNGYTYAAQPTVSTATPNSGPAAGGQTGVVIAGTNLSNATSVSFAGTLATITNNTATALTVTTPVHAAGTVNVLVTTAGGNATINNGYTFVAAPAITGVVPNSGPVTGGQTVVLSGSNLGNATGVTMGGAPATVTNNTVGSITVTTPVHAIGAVNVVVTTVGGTGTSTYTYVAGPAVRFSLSGPAAAIAGASVNMTVTALDAFDNVANSYLGTVHFTSSDGRATTPPDSTLAGGTGTFSATLFVAGSQTITAADGSITGTSGAIVVAPANATHAAVSAPPAATAGSGFSVSVTALDAFDNVATGYTGTVQFTSTDATATLSVGRTLTGGTGTFAATLFAAGAQTITAADGPITGTSGTIVVTPTGATHFAVSAPGAATAGNSFPFTVTALDAFNNIATTYSGTTHVLSSDATATLSSDSALTNGAGTFSATLRIAGSQTISAADGPITGTSNAISVSPAAATRFSLSAPASATAGSPFNVTVNAFDVFDNIATGYGGMVHFTSSDASATLPADRTLTNGTALVSATLRVAGPQTISAADGAIAGTSNTITVVPAAATHFTLSAPASIAAGSPFSVTVTALDTFNNIATAYAGIAHFSSTDGAATLPPNSTLTGGSGTFNATLHTAGSRTITATDGGITGTSGIIAVSASTATHFALAAPSSTIAGVPITVTVTPLDAFDNLASDYAGMVHLTSTDGQASLPADAAAGTFGTTLRTAGSQTISASDGTINGTSSPITVAPSTATRFALSAPSSATAGSAFLITVAARDAFDNTVSSYGGILHFTSSDATATPPPDSTLVGGTGTFSATLVTAGSQTLTAGDGTISGVSNAVAVAPAAATHFSVTASAGSIAGSPLNVTVTALDTFNNVATGYGGMVHFTSSDATATLSADSPLTSGSVTFSAVLRIVGTQTITAGDSAITGTSNPIDIASAPATHFAVSAPATATAGSAFNVTVTALDAFNNTATDYTSTAHVSSSDPAAVLPADSTLTKGLGAFSATLRTAGTRTITMIDGAVTGTSNAIEVTPGATTHFTLTAPPSTVAGSAFNISLTAFDAFSNQTPAYAGTVHLTSGDVQATLPADAALTGGSGSFAVTLRTIGSESLTAADGAITGSASVMVNTSGADHLIVEAAAGGGITSQIAGAPFAILITARDAFGNIDSGFAGTISLVTNDGPISPATVPFAAADAGVKSATVTLMQAGSGRTITATSSTRSGTSAPFAVDAGPLHHFRVEAVGGGSIGAQTANVPFALRITALDAGENVVTSFNNSVAISSTAQLLTGGGSTAAFSAGVLSTHSLSLGGSGTQTITATSGAIIGTSNAFAVNAVADVKVSVTGSSTALPGSQATYTMVVENRGPSPAHAPTVTLTLPANWQFYSVTPCTLPCVLTDLAPSTSTLFQITVEVPRSAGSDAPYDIIAGAVSTTPDPVSANNQATMHTSVPLIACPVTPSTLQPAGGTAPASGTLRWAATGDDFYQVYFGPQGSGCTTLAGETRDPSFEYQNLLPGKRYEWRVIAQHDGCPVVSSACVTFDVATECPTPDAVILGAVAEISSGAAYHVSWNDVGAERYDLQEATDASFADAQTIATTDHSAEFLHEAASATSYYYRVRPVIDCLGQLPFTTGVRVVVLPRRSNDGLALDLMVENGSADSLSQTIHLPAPAGAKATSINGTFIATTDQPWLTITPPSGSIPPSGLDVMLTVNTAGRQIGTSVATAHLATADGGSIGDVRVNLNVGAMMTAQPRTLPIPANVALLPAVAHAPGASAFWQSDVRLYNPAAIPAGYVLSFTASAEDGTLSGRRVEITVPGGATIAFDDVVRHLFGYGAFGDEAAIGSLEVRPKSADGRAVVTSRTYAFTPAGTYGQAIPAFSASSFAAMGTPLSLTGLAQSDAYRTNVGLIEASGHPATVRIHVYDASGRELTQFDVNLGRLEQRQLNSLLADHSITSDNARIELDVVSPDALVGGYASIVDNRTADPTLTPAVNPSLVSAARYVVPGVADLMTGRNTWRTDVRIYNPANASVTADMVFFAQGSSTTMTRQVTIAPGEVRAFDSILRSLFTTSDVGGALHIVTPTLSNLVITARTYDASSEGTYGQFIPAVTSSNAIGIGERELQILHLEQSTAYRANIGFVEVAGKSAQLQVTATLADGRTSSTVLNLQPYEFLQIGSMLQTLGFDSATNARLTLRVIAGSGRVTGYASIIDNRTGDPTYMPAQ